MDEFIISKARSLAERVHDKIYRKYIVPQEPYIEHPRRCAERAAQLRLPEPLLSVGVATMFCHDCLEDASVDGIFLTFQQLAEMVSYDVAVEVDKLTNPSKGSPLLRPERKALDRAHIAGLDGPSRLRKMIDRTDNLRSMGEAPAGFRKLYLGESILLLEAIGQVDSPDFPELEQEYQDALDGIRRSLPKV